MDANVIDLAARRDADFWDREDLDVLAEHLKAEIVEYLRRRQSSSLERARRLLADMRQVAGGRASPPKRPPTSPTDPDAAIAVLAVLLKDATARHLRHEATRDELRRCVGELAAAVG